MLPTTPGPFTFKGTVSYIIGRGKVAILDPGPDDDAHVAALLDAVRGETVTHIFVTHTHRDHSPAVPKVKAATGATVYAEGPHRLARPLHIGETRRLDASADMDFRPDVALPRRRAVSGAGWTLEAVTTPGHTANHMAFAFKESNLMFSGDHIMAWSTTIVAPPDGAMSDYMASLHKLTRRTEPVYFPGHGGAVRDAPRFVQHYIHHRQGREASILHRLAKGEADIPTMVRAIYIGLEPRLVGAASLSVLAHLEDLVARGVVATEGPPAIGSTYRLADAPLRRLSGLRRRLCRLLLLLLLRHRRAEQIVDVFDQRAHALGVGAEVVTAVARGRAHVDAGAVAGRAHAHHHVVAKAEDRRSRHRLDDAVATRLPAAAVGHRRCAICAW